MHIPLISLLLGAALVSHDAYAVRPPLEQELTDALVSWTHRERGIVAPWVAALAPLCDTREECLHVAALAVEETYFVSWVLDYSCNDAAWRRRMGRDKSCDEGRAVGPWQLLDMHGLIGAAPSDHATFAVIFYRRSPRLWTTWRAADARAKHWLAHHP